MENDATDLEFVDVTHLVGSARTKEEDEALERLLEAYAVATSHPSIPNFRACVRAHDDLREVSRQALLQEIAEGVGAAVLEKDQ